MILYFYIFNDLSDPLKNTYSELEFKYILNEDPAKEYTVYSVLLYEDNFKLSLINGKF